MKTTWPTVSFGDLLTRRPPDTAVDPTTMYQFAGVYSFARGAFRGQERAGSTFSYRVLTRLRHNEFLFPKLMAWEGAFAVVPEACDGCYVSPEFPVFEIDQERLSPRFLHFYFKIRSVWERISGGSIGTNVRRRRLHPREFLRQTISLPTREEQERIVRKIETLAVKVDEARLIRAASMSGTEIVFTQFARGILKVAKAFYGSVPILDVIDFEGGSQPPKSQFQQEAAPGLVRFLQIRDYSSDNHLTYIPTSKRNSMVEPHEVLIGRYGASLGKVLRGKKGAYNVAMCKAVPLRGDIDHDFLAYQLAHGDFQRRLAEISRSAQAGFNKADLRGVEFVLLPAVEQKRFIAEFESFYKKVDAIKDLQSETAVEMETLLPAILDMAFQGKL